MRADAATPGLVALRLADDSIVPPLDDIRRWIDWLRADPRITTVRTSAMFPKAAQRFAEAGFAVADTLSLLRADLAEPAARASLAEAIRDGGAATAPLRHHHDASAARVDRAAFGDQWGHDAAELAEIRAATPVHRARCRSQRNGVFGREIYAVALSGASAEHGYLQRLSVDPAHQRQGHGRALLLDALGWMARRRLPDCLVNTSVENVAALALYSSTGFQPMSDCLRVLHCDVRAE